MAYEVRVIPRARRRIMRPSDPMKTPYGLQVIESCLSCTLHRDKLFCDLPGSALQGLDAISSSATYPKGAVLFVEGQAARGIFVICHGRVKLTAGATDGKTLILRIAESGEVVGLPGTISGKPYEVTAETLEPVQANFVSRDDFLHFLRTHGEVAVRVAEILSDIYFATCREVRYLGLSGSASAKLARFVLDLAGEQVRGSSNGEQLHTKLTLTHEEIAEIIGASRETVTRMFADFKRKKLVRVAGSTLVITDKPGLEKMSGA
jgi:CRP/FNR family cyclic AMP-dependent transcriptional regulator